MYSYKTKIGTVFIDEDGKSITYMGLNSICEGGRHCETELTRRAVSELREYLDGGRKEFDLPLNPKGTEFQKKVWKALLDIPYGETRSYKEIAEAVGSPKAYRAVGMANNKNPILIFIPCHRVIGSDGSLVGYGEGLELKAKLLNLEKDRGLNGN